MLPDITTSAAVLAAVAGVLNLAVTAYFAGRRERLKWAREAIGEATFEFVDASFQVKDAAKRLQHLHTNKANSLEVEAAYTEMWEQRERLRNSLTKLRVLSPARTVQAAQVVRQATSNYCNALGPELTTEQQDQLTDEIRRAREEFIARARRRMGLRG